VTTILAGLVAALFALPAQAANTTPSACSTHWGTAPREKALPLTVANEVHTVRAGQHACFDRLVVDLGVLRAPGYKVSYVRAFYADGSGKLVRTSGQAKLLVVVRAPATLSFAAVNRHLVSVAGFAEFRQVVGLGSFERVTSIGLGLKAKEPFRVFEFRTASHKVELVIDVAHP
jgi:hypothetical protein